MDKFKKITEEFYYDINRVEQEKDIRMHLVGKVAMYLTASTADNQMMLEESLIDCESPIEQLLSLEFENIGIKRLYKFNPFIDVVEVEKQKEIRCGENMYRVDFLIPVIYKNQESKCFVIECDGHEFHQKTKEQVERDNTRTRELQRAGYEIIRFSGTEIWRRPHRCAEEVLNIILSKCQYIREGK